MSGQLKRFLVKDLRHPRVVLDANDSHHLRNVLRLKFEDFCLVTDANGRQASARVHSFLPNGQVELKLTSEPELIHKNSYIIVAQAMPQRGIMDALVHKAGELGVATLIPMMTKRTQVRIAKTALERVMTRWSRIVREAAKQSGNPETFVEAPVELSEILARHKNFGRIYLAHPKADPLDYKGFIAKQSDSQILRRADRPAPLDQAADRRSNKRRRFAPQNDTQSVILSEAKDLDQIAANNKGNIPSVLILIGPEGGFTDQEVNDAQIAGAKVFSLFSGVLKIETAFAGIVSLFRYLLETAKSS